MFTLIRRKLQNRKLLNGCLLLGITLFISIAACTPMFKKGSLNRLIQSKFTDYIEENNEYPSVIGRSGSCKTQSFPTVEAITGKIDSYGESWQKYMKISAREIETCMYVEGNRVTQQYDGKNNWSNIAYIPDLEKHITVVKGNLYGEEKKDDNIYPCIITEKVMDNCNFVVGEQIRFEDIKDKDGNVLTMQIIGIFDEKSNTDIFWHVETSELNKQVYVSEGDMEDILSRFSFDTVYFDYYMMLDYSEINSRNIMDLQDYLQQFHKLDENFTDNFTELLEEYRADKRFIDTIFWVLELPIFVLLLAFVYMVSGQILTMETGEISMLKSRGFSKKQIVFMYLCQSGILAGMGVIIGLPLGYLLCKMAASTNAFLQFSLKSTAIYKPTAGMIVYALAASLITVAFMTLPVIGYSRYSIVEQKSKKADLHSVNFIEKYFLDVILFLFSSYLLYNYGKQKELLAWDVMTGEKLDPMVFLNVSFFLLACGLVGLRLIKYLVRLVYFIGKEKWKPHMYASFLQIMRTRGKQNFISVFLVLTIAMGIFNSNMAGTINTNNNLRTRYNVGADAVVQEHWDMEVFVQSSGQPDWIYNEPDYQRYSALKEDICGNMTRVVRDDNVKVSSSNKSIQGCSMMAIHTKEFGETAKLEDGLNKEHWYHYLNTLAKNASGVLISRNLAEEFNIKVGDSIQYARFQPVIYNQDEEIASCNGIVCGIFDAWPGYEQYGYGYNEKGEWEEQQRYMIVVNYAYELSVFGMMPYEIWMDLKDDAFVPDVRTYLKENEIETDFVKGADEEISEILDSAMIQITNGLFTLSFIISIILCTIGFLIYWVTSIKQRELLFGIYRAMGMSMKEVNKMLVNEQIFSSLLAGVMGGIAGFATTLLFVKIVAVVYLPRAHNIGLRLHIDVIDMCRLGLIVLLMIVICLMVLRYIVKNSSITQAIKMGED
ncbi:MAG: ABC transporter permease [Lachnospiraceae bacterium]|nr:ABC transporter permease [Lachnospiraceae bacterium]